MTHSSERIAHSHVLRSASKHSCRMPRMTGELKFVTYAHLVPASQCITISACHKICKDMNAAHVTSETQDDSHMELCLASHFHMTIHVTIPITVSPSCAYIQALVDGGGGAVLNSLARATDATPGWSKAWHG